jgi:hypothetical protein
MKKLTHREMELIIMGFATLGKGPEQTHWEGELWGQSYLLRSQLYWVLLGKSSQQRQDHLGGDGREGM